MTINQTLSQITSTPKWYIGHYSQSHASKLIKSIKDGKMPIGKMVIFFAKFGYEVEVNINKQQIEIK